MTIRIQRPKVEPRKLDASDELPVTTTLGMVEYRDAVACLYGISELSPRIADRMMRKIIAIYRHLATVSERKLKGMADKMQ